MSYNRLRSLLPLKSRGIRKTVKKFLDAGFVKVTFRRGKNFRVEILKPLPFGWFDQEPEVAEAAPEAVQLPIYIASYAEGLKNQGMDAKGLQETTDLMVRLDASKKVVDAHHHGINLISACREIAQREHMKNPDPTKEIHSGYLFRFKLRKQAAKYGC